MLHDLRYAVRGLLRDRGFTATAILTLAVGIGAVTSIFSVADAVIFRPFPFPHQDRLVMVWDQLRAMRQDRFPLTSRTFDLYSGEDRVFESTAAFMQLDRTVTRDGASESVPAILAGKGLFEMLGANPAIGRTFTTDEYRPGRANTVMLSYRYFLRQFGGDRAIVGKTIRIDGQNHTVTGILAPRFGFSIRAGDVDLWTPLPTADGQRWGALSMIARLRPGVSIGSAQSALDIVARRYVDTEHPRRGPNGEDPGFGVQVIGLREQLLGTYRFATLVLLAAVGAVLLIACANVANLLLVRAVAREKETVVRRALGASDVRLVRQWMTESALLAVLGGSLGTLAASWMLTALVALSPAALPTIAFVRIDSRVLVFTVAVSALVCFLFGLAPSIAAVRPRLTPRRTRRRTASVLVAAEVALATVLLVSAGLLLQSFVRLIHVDPGFQADHLLTMRIQFAPSRPVARTASAAFFGRVRDRLAALPGVRSASAVSRLPVAGRDPNARGGNPFAIEGLAWSPTNLAHTQSVGLDYFRTMQIALIGGRAFNDTDKPDGNVAIINQTLAGRYFANSNPIGHRIGLGGARPETPWYTIVGVTADVKTATLDQDTMPQIYFPQAQVPSIAMHVVLRTAGDPRSVMRAAESAVYQIDPDMPVYDVKTMEDRVAESVGQPRFLAAIVMSFASTALFLAAIGIFGVVAHATAQRTREIGIRIALGADAKRISRFILSSGMRPVAAGLVMGIAGAVAAARLLGSLLFHVTATDPLAFGLALAALALTATVACLGPARRASLIDPAVALRAE